MRRTIMLVGLSTVLAAAFWAGCGGDGGGETTVIREEVGTSDAAVVEQAEKIAELEEELEAQKKAAASKSASAPDPSPERESEPSPPGSVPDVVGERLDVAKRTLKDAGYQTRISGGGVFGVVDTRNWVVCDQNPGSGGKVDLNVDRSC